MEEEEEEKKKEKKRQKDKEEGGMDKPITRRTVCSRENRVLRVRGSR